MIYLASPFFNPQQDQVVEDLKRSMGRFNLEYYSPKDQFRVNFKIDPPEKLEQCFQANIKAIRDADLILAVIDDFDPGTIWEMGYASANKKIILAYSNVPGRGLNLMLSQSCKGFCNGIVELEAVLDRYKKLHRIDTVVWKGEIE